MKLLEDLLLAAIQRQAFHVRVLGDCEKLRTLHVQCGFRSEEFRLAWEYAFTYRRIREIVITGTIEI